MIEELPTDPTPEVPAPEPDAGFEWPPYPEYGSPEDKLARMRLTIWIHDQIAAGKVEVNRGDYVIATDGLILGVGPDDEEISRRIFAPESPYRNARVIAVRVPFEYE